MQPLSLNLLGSFSVSLAGQPVESFHSVKNQALLIYLAVDCSHAHRRESLFTLLWPGMPERSARHNLRQAPYTLGQMFPDLSANAGDHPIPLLVTDRQTVQLNPAACVESDVHLLDQLLTGTQSHRHTDLSKCQACIQALKQAALMNHGGFLVDFYLEDSSEFEYWAATHRAAYQKKIFETLQTLADIAVESKEYRQASAYIERQLVMDSLKESTHRQKMNVLALSGRRVEALRHYRRLAQLLQQELGISPSQETQALYERIRAQDPALSPPQPEMISEPAATPRHNLVLQATPLIGRQEELTRLDDMLASPHTRLITITGPGGIGKTRLALAAGEAQLRARQIPENILRFPDGVFFVGLAALNEANQIAPAITTALKLPLQGGKRTPQQQTLDYLRPKQALLILDNFEHLKAGVAFLMEILHAAPGVKLIVSSRERLQLHAEQLLPIRGLDFPEREAPQVALEYPSGQLFLLSARRNNPNFSPQTGDLGFLASICRHLEGIPLALELAAAWVDVLSIESILDEIQGGLDFLQAARRDLPVRHHSMRATIDVSWQRLDQYERDIFAQLAVFRGGFTRQAAQEVTGADLNLLSRLVNKSFLQYDQANQRFQTHELLRRFGADKMAEDSQVEIAVRDQHSKFYCHQLAEKERELWLPQTSIVWAGLEADFRNIEDAWRWSVQGRRIQNLHQAIQIMFAYYTFNNRLIEGISLGEWTIDQLTPHDASNVENADGIWISARILSWQARYYLILGKFAQAERLINQSETLFQQLAPASLPTELDQAFLFNPMGWLALQKRHFEEALECAEKSRRLAKTSGDRVSESFYTGILGFLYSCFSDFEMAERMYTECIALLRSENSTIFLAIELTNMGSVLRNRMDYARSEALFRESALVARSLNEFAVMANALSQWGNLKLFLGEFGRAVEYLQQGLEAAKEIFDFGYESFCMAILASAYALCGQFTRARQLIDESVALAEIYQDPGSRNELWIGAFINIWMGRYETARSLITRSFSLLEDKEALRFFRPIFHAPYGSVGWIALVENDFEAARENLREQINFFRSMSMEREWRAIYMATLSLAEWRLGDKTAARRHLTESLATAVEIRAFITLLHVLAILPLMLADEEDGQKKARAVEINAMANSHPFIAKCQFFYDIAGRYMQAVEAALPPEIVAAAKARGVELDFWPTAEALLGELRQLGWGETAHSQAPDGYASE